MKSMKICNDCIYIKLCKMNEGIDNLCNDISNELKFARIFVIKNLDNFTCNEKETIEDIKTKYESLLRNKKKCNVCYGIGKIPRDSNINCSTCEGKGYIIEKK